MVTLASRTRKLRQLLGIRLGPGALVLPKDVYRINMTFAQTFGNRKLGGHMGPKKFWRQVLPKLKYHNPSVSMNVEHTVQPGDPATLAVFFHSKQSTAGSSRAPPAQTSSDTSGQTSGPSDRADSSSVMKTIAMKDKHSDDILREFIELTNAKQVESTAADQAMLEELRESEEAGARHRARSAILKAERMREQASLKAAQQEAIASTTAVTEQ